MAFTEAMRFTMDAWPGLADGSITVTFRRWKRCQVVLGNQYRSPSGMLEVLAVDELADASAIKKADAKKAGSPDLESLLERLGPPVEGTTLYRVEFRNAGADPRDELRKQIPDDDEMDTILKKLDRLDARSSYGPWTTETLRMIAEQPGVRAPDLAAQVGRETKPFKLDVRKLKSLGLTESQKVGYNLSPRGAAVANARLALD